ncbi:MAG: pectate lyase, partial [Duncaniella sp.]|nr:pectate lyase [Duncaniella sp.]
MAAISVSATGADGLAFPGAEGYGKHTRGGRGGRVMKVTNLNDSGPGSLREAVEAEGARIVVFDVDGTIELQSPLRINNDSITIAGQTAPGDGVCLKDYPLVVNASEVIVRYLRVRPGDRHALDSDGIGGGRYGQRNVILDHCSVSWSIDECLSIYKTENLTVQWCLVAHSLNRSVHTKGSHGFGGIWGGFKATFHHNLLANHS